jgi:hypothetical protein
MVMAYEFIGATCLYFITENLLAFGLEARQTASIEPRGADRPNLDTDGTVFPRRLP